jgi:hypothetical protein
VAGKEIHDDIEHELPDDLLADAMHRPMPVAITSTR